MATEVLVYGAGGHAKVVIDILERAGQYQIAGILDDRTELHGSEFCGYQLLGGCDVLREDKYRACAAVFAVGDNAARMALWERLQAFGVSLALAVHPSAQIGRDVRLGAGTVVMAGAVVNPGSIIEQNVILNTGATVDHDCRIGACVHISPGAHLAGNVSVGALAHIGTGASIVPDVSIGRGAIVGAGAAVVSDVPDGVTVAGVPARRIEPRAKEEPEG